MASAEGLNVERDKTLRELQTSLPWTIRYSRDFRANPQPHKDFTHALLHVAKALGKLHGLADDMDHDREVADDPKLRDQYGKYVADLVVCALRAANVFPGGVLDLQREVQHRIVVKNVQALKETVSETPTFMVVEAMQDDKVLGVVPVPSDWHNGQIMLAVEAAYPHCSGFRERQLPKTPVCVGGAVAEPDDKSSSGSLHWAAMDDEGRHLGTFWAPKDKVSSIGRKYYPELARAKRLGTE